MTIIILIICLILFIYNSIDNPNIKKDKCSDFVLSKEGIDKCLFCGSLSNGSYFLSPTSNDPNNHEFECSKCNKEHWG